MFKKVMIANDGSEGADKALGLAIELAAKMGAELHMICVEETPQFPVSIDEVVEERRDAAHLYERVVRSAKRRAEMAGLHLHSHLVSGHAVSTIVDMVQRDGFDLLVVGFMGHSALYNRLVGGTTDRLVELAGCHVLVVK